MAVTAKQKLARLKKRPTQKPQRPKVKEHRQPKPKPRVKPRKPGEKKAKINGTKLLTLPQYPDPRIPREPSPLMEFIESCGGEVSDLEAIHEFQEHWCDHPRSAMSLQGLMPSLDPENVYYTRRCNQCGKVKELKGRPPAWLERR